MVRCNQRTNFIFALLNISSVVFLSLVVEYDFFMNEASLDLLYSHSHVHDGNNRLEQVKHIKYPLKTSQYVQKQKYHTDIARKQINISNEHLRNGSEFRRICRPGDSYAKKERFRMVKPSITRIIEESKHKIRVYINQEGHTLANIVQNALRKDHHIAYVGYEVIPGSLIIEVRTTSNTKKHPMEFLRNALENQYQVFQYVSTHIYNTIPSVSFFNL